MEYKKTVKSWNKSTNKDCFDLGGESNIDHICPVALKGSDTAENKQRISKVANQEKADDTAGTINGYRFSIEVHLTKTNKQGVQHKIGTMYIRKPEGQAGVGHKVKSE